MPRYYAVVKLHRNPSPASVTFEADDSDDAVKVMCKSLGCASTSEMLEFDLLQIVGPQHYRPIASRAAKAALGSPEERKASYRAVLDGAANVSSQQLLALPPPTLATSVFEREYKPYSLKRD